ncbi:MAG: GntR family transcriptional regulator [Bacteroidota bacterium]
MKLDFDDSLDIHSRLPKYVQVKNQLARQIKAGTYLANEIIPSESELMKTFGVSRFTIREAIKELVQDGLLRTEQGKGTFVCQNTKFKTLSNKIALLSMSVNTYIFPEIANGVLSLIKDSDYQLILAHTEYSHEQEKQELLKLINQSIAGLIVELTLSAKPNPNLELFLQLKRMGVPIVQIDSKNDDLGSPYVILDDELGGYLAGQHLLNLGHRKAAVVYNSNHQPAVLRMQGFKRAMKEAGVIIPKHWIKGFEHRQEVGIDYGYQMTEELLELSDRPTAIFFFNDEHALEGCQAIWDRGLNIPEDISVVGFDDSELANLSRVRLTTLSHPKADLGKIAANILLDMIENGYHTPVNPDHRIVIKPELIIRDSCRRL